MISVEGLGIVAKALKFAAHKHQQQRRKNELQSPYINRMVELLINVGGIDNATVLAAGALHDVIEDTKTTEDELRKVFGDNLVDIVMECSDDKSLPKMVRKQLQITTAHAKSWAARAIKLADKTCNIRDITYSPPVTWTPEGTVKYLEWSDEVVNRLRGTNAALEAYYDQCSSEAHRAVEIRNAKLVKAEV